MYGNIKPCHIHVIGEAEKIFKETMVEHIPKLIFKNYKPTNSKSMKNIKQDKDHIPF